MRIRHVQSTSVSFKIFSVVPRTQQQPKSAEQIQQQQHQRMLNLLQHSLVFPSQQILDTLLESQHHLLEQEQQDVFQQLQTCFEGFTTSLAHSELENHFAVLQQHQNAVQRHLDWLQQQQTQQQAQWLKHLQQLEQLKQLQPQVQQEQQQQQGLQEEEVHDELDTDCCIREVRMQYR
ncbi:hypothetical protein MAM1_1037d11426 [Mucor ambiguus]|uniref:Uncharacterized protein n=1 Tax=Mucor ambiguus TaxID=91626 RepID=A0A0C9N6Y1_9FUNG|nr:hypothetical protein MAM1_1037d11426 [Mucor ambiguus]